MITSTGSVCPSVRPSVSAATARRILTINRNFSHSRESRYCCWRTTGRRRQGVGPRSDVRALLEVRWSPCEREREREGDEVCRRRRDKQTKLCVCVGLKPLVQTCCLREAVIFDLGLSGLTIPASYLTYKHFQTPYSHMANTVDDSCVCVCVCAVLSSLFIQCRPSTACRDVYLYV